MRNQRLLPLTFFLFLLIFAASVSGGTYNFLQRQGFDTPDQVFTQADFDYTDYTSENSLSTGSKYIMVCSDDVWLTQTTPVCVGVDSTDTMRTYIYNTSTGMFVQINKAGMTGINTFGAEVSTSGIAGSQGLAFADIDGDGYDELLMAGYNLTSGDTEGYVLTGDGTDWLIDWMDDITPDDLRGEGIEIACGDDANTGNTECFVIYPDIANDQNDVKWFNDTGQEITLIEDSGAASGEMGDKITTPVYFTCFDIDGDGEVTCVWVQQDADKWSVLEYSPEGYTISRTVSTIIADIDSLLDGDLDGTDEAATRLFMNIMDVTDSAGYEYVFSALEKTGSDYNVHFLITSNTGSHIANYTVMGDANSRISQPYICVHDNEFVCIQAKLPDDNYIIYYDGVHDNFVSNSNLDADCEIFDHVPYMEIFESESDSGLTDDFFYFTNAAMCAGYTGQEILGSCIISGTTYNVVTDLDDDDSYDFIWYNDDDSCLVISDIGGGVNYQPSISPLDTYYAEFLCVDQEQNWTFTWSDVENDNSQFRYKCHSSESYGSWSIADSDTTKSFACDLNQTIAGNYTTITNLTCNNFFSWCTWNSLFNDVENITVWYQNPVVQMRDIANHVIYINPTTSQASVGFWANSSSCFDDGTLDTTTTFFCGDGVCSGSETIQNCPDDCILTTTTLATGVSADNGLTSAMQVADEYSGFGLMAIWLLIMAFVAGIIWVNAGHTGMMGFGVVAIVEILLLIIGTLFGFLPASIIVIIVIIMLIFAGIMLRKMMIGGE